MNLARLSASSRPRTWSPVDPATGSRLLDRGPLLRTRRHVLIADDDGDTREMYAWCLRAAGWIVTEVGDGQEALEAAALHCPDIIVMDLRMPVLNGLDAVVRLRKDARTRSIPIVVCTGLESAAVERKALLLRCDGFVAKPCRPDALLALLEDVTGRAE